MVFRPNVLKVVGSDIGDQAMKERKMKREMLQVELEPSLMDQIGFVNKKNPF